MREILSIDGKPLDNERFCKLVEELTKKKYRPIIDPRNFDNPVTINARFKTKETKIRFLEISPKLDVIIEHTGNKVDGKKLVSEIRTHVQESLPREVVQPKDFELATLQMISRKEPVIIPKNTAERKMFMSLVEKNIFTIAHMIECPDCNSSFMFPKESFNLGGNVFCKDCEKWFEIKRAKEAFVMQEDYMKAMNGMWGKMQKMIKASWREVVKKGVPMIPKV
jgi:uncharacterized protein YbaR (Trm112 family)